MNEWELRERETEMGNRFSQEIPVQEFIPGVVDGWMDDEGIMGKVSFSQTKALRWEKGDLCSSVCLSFCCCG